MTSQPPEPLGNGDAIYRRVPPWHLVPDGNAGARRASSAAFECRSDEAHASCYVESLLSEHRIDPVHVVDGHEGYGSARVPLETLRSHGFDAVPDPDGIDPEHPHPCDPAHGALIEPDGTPSGSVKNRRRLAKDPAVQLVILPDAE
jgi:hypothetical protein